MTVQRYSRSFLRQLAVVFSAYEILHLEKNNLVARKDTSKEKITDIPFDIEDKTHEKLAEGIKHIEKVVYDILKKIKLHKKDENFFIEKCENTLQGFLDSGILEKGVSPHMTFILMLYTYFADGKAGKINQDFQVLADFAIYETLFLIIEDSSVFDWKAHTEAVYYFLNKGVGFSIYVDEGWEKTPITIDTFIANGYNESDSNFLFKSAKRLSRTHSNSKQDYIYLKDLLMNSEKMITSKSYSKYNSKIFSELYNLSKKILDQKNSKNEEGIKIWSG